MSVTCQEKSVKFDNEIQMSWNKALIDARSMLFEAEQRVKRLKEAIKGIKDKIKADEQWPSHDNNQTTHN